MLELYQGYFEAGYSKVEARSEGSPPWSKMTKSGSFLLACVGYPPGWLEQHLLPRPSKLERIVRMIMGKEFEGNTYRLGQAIYRY